MRIVFWVILAFVVATLLIALVLAATGGAAVLVPIAPWWVLIAFWTWLFYGGLGWQQARAYTKLHGGGPFPVDFELTDVGIRHETPVSANELKWSIIRRVVETPDFLLFFYSWQCALYLPRRAVEPAVEYQTLAEALSERFAARFTRHGQPQVRPAA